MHLPYQLIKSTSDRTSKPLGSFDQREDDCLHSHRLVSTPKGAIGATQFHNDLQLGTERRDNSAKPRAFTNLGMAIGDRFPFLLITVASIGVAESGSEYRHLISWFTLTNLPLAYAKDNYRYGSWNVSQPQ